ncbi:MAG: hypothetical protein JXQ73_18905 [Phycisphaerae bacterium]|nr:hypothetical protein [Phycisphaerae bacterium]
MKGTNDCLATWAVLGCAGIGLIATGCDWGGGSGFGGAGYTGHKRQIMCPSGDVRPVEAMALGQRVLAKHGFSIKSSDADSLTIETHANEKVVRGGEGRVRDSVVKVPNRVRRTASLEFSSKGENLEAWCQVKMERLTTADYRVFASQRQFEDAPTQTPIEGEGATTAKQNTVWTSAGRDESMEREILADLRQRIQTLRQKKQETPQPAEKK